MPKVVVVQRVKDVAKWEGAAAQRKQALSGMASDVTSYTDPNGGDVVATSMTVSDLGALDNMLSSPDAKERFEKAGVIVESVRILVE